MKYNGNLWGLCLFLFFFMGMASAQNTVTGKIIDSVSRQPIEYILVSDSANATIKTLTDAFGNFYFKPKSTTLRISGLGYAAFFYPLSGDDNIRIALKASFVSLKDIVLTADHATSFNSIAKIDLDVKPVRNTQELMRLVPGLFIAQHAGGGKAEQIFLRGFDCDHGTDVQVSMDGMPVNMVSHAHGQGYADAHFIIAETIKDVDFGAGPYYTAHGDLNTAGYIAFTSFDAINKSRIQVEAGRFNTFRTLAMIDLLKKNKDKQTAYIAAEYYFTNGPTINKQQFKKYNIFGKYNLAVSAKTQLSASLATFKSDWNASGQVPTRAVDAGLIDRFGSIDPTEGGNTERTNANVILTHHYNTRTNWENQFFYSRYLFNLYSNFTYFLNDPVNGDEINQGEKRNLLGYISKLTKKYAYQQWQFTSTAAAGFRYDATENSRLWHVVKRQFLNDVKLGNIKEANIYAYAQQQASIGKWFFDGGIRFDYLHFNYQDKLSAQLPAQGRSIASPKLNIQYTLNNRVQFFVKAGKGFHSNDARVVVANQGYQILPAAYGTDLGMTVKPVKNLFVSVAIWQLYLDQEFVYVGDDGNVEPSGKTTRRGIDVIARYQFNQHLFLTANVNLTKPRANGPSKGQDYIPLAPTASSTGGIYYKNNAGINGSLSYRYIAHRPANEDNSIVAKGYFLADAAVNYNQPHYEIGLAFENLLNVKWNEAQFATESRLTNETAPVTELNFTPGTPFFARVKFAVFF